MRVSSRRGVALRGRSPQPVVDLEPRGPDLVRDGGHQAARADLRVRLVVQEVAEPLLAPVGVPAGVQDEYVPARVDLLGGARVPPCPVEPITKTKATSGLS
jgi:hypothetical protein